FPEMQILTVAGRVSLGGSFFGAPRLFLVDFALCSILPESREWACAWGPFSGLWKASGGLPPRCQDLTSFPRAPTSPRAGPCIARFPVPERELASRTSSIHHSAVAALRLPSGGYPDWPGSGKGNTALRC